MSSDARKGRRPCTSDGLCKTTYACTMDEGTGSLCCGYTNGVDSWGWTCE